MTDLYLGTSGYSYKDWEGIFYPENIKSSDYLVFYGKYFNSVEINFSYYAVPNPYLFSALSAKVDNDFLFSVKAHSSMTHQRNANEKIYSDFLKALEPLAISNKMGPVLFQFPYSFHFSVENLSYLLKLRKIFKDFDAVFEFRNSQWVRDEVFYFLKENNAGFANVDEPSLSGLMPGSDYLTNDTFYLRFHGRNSEKWWNHEKAYERYDYMYSEPELNSWVPKIKKAVLSAKKSFIYFNNHYKAKAVSSANILLKLIKT